MSKIITNFNTHQIGEQIDNAQMMYADELCRQGHNEHDDRIVTLETGSPYVTCATPGATQTKAISINRFRLRENFGLTVYFTYGFTTTGSKLEITYLDDEGEQQTTGAKDIYLYGSAIAPHKVLDHTIVQMVYDGTRWNVISIEHLGATTVSGAVDLGLPSGLLWADKNIGAATPEAPGLYFSWGNVIGHAEGSGYDFGSNNEGPYASTPGAELTADIAVGDTYDAARNNMGSPWRLPTNEDFQELYDNCDVVWIEENGMPGQRFTSRIDGNSVFFPAAGYYNGTTLYSRGTNGNYWSSVLADSASARYLYFNSGGVNPQHANPRFYGLSVRAVQ